MTTHPRPAGPPTGRRRLRAVPSAPDHGPVHEPTHQPIHEGEVIAEVRRLEREREAGTVRKPGRAMTVEAWLTHWLENIARASVRRSGTRRTGRIARRFTITSSPASTSTG